MSKLEAWKFFKAFFLHGFLLGLTRRLLLVIILLTVAAILFLGFGAPAGIPLLFWHEIPQKQMLAGFAVGVLIFVILFVAFLLDTPERRGKWLSKLPPSVQIDVIHQLKYYLLGSLLSLGVVGLLGFLLWKSGNLLELRHSASAAQIFSAIGLEDANPTTTEEHGRWLLQRSPTAVIRPYWFIGGFLVAGLILYAFGWLLAPTLRAATPADGLPRRGRKRMPDNMADQLVIEQRLKILLRIVAALLLLNYLLSCFGLSVATPATAVCTVLGLVAIAYGFITYRQWNRTLVLLLVALLMMWGGCPRYKIRVPGLAYYYPENLLVDPYATPATRPAPATRPGDLIHTVDVMWTRSEEPRRPLVLVCVSGGGIRASVWSATVLCALERRVSDFPYHIRMISGASGGMVGAAYYTSTLLPPPVPSPVGATARHVIKTSAVDPDGLDTLVGNLAKDSLSLPVKRMIFHDLPLMLCGIDNQNDRGLALEREWREYWDSDLNLKLTGGASVGSTTFGALWQGEKAGWRPSLVFTPMIVEDGRRLIISNLELDCLTINRGPQLQGFDPRSIVKPDGFYSRSGMQLALMFPQAWPEFQVVTAARLSASFPYVSPAAVLPTSPRRRVVDAGYYDNYGVTTATSWLADCINDPVKRAWLQRHVSGVLILQVRDGRNKLNQLKAVAGDSNGSPGGRGLEWLTSPVTGVLSARDSVSVFRNDASLQKVSELLACISQKGEFDPEYFATAAVEFPGDAPLSWYLTAAEIKSLKEAVGAPTPGQLPNQAYQELNLVQTWFNSRRGR